MHSFKYSKVARVRNRTIPDLPLIITKSEGAQEKAIALLNIIYRSSCYQIKIGRLIGFYLYS